MRTYPALVASPRYAPAARLAGLLLGAATLLAGCATHDVAPTPLAAAQASTDLTASLGNGVNLQPSYYNGGNPNFGWSLMKQQPNIKTVRIEIEPGYVSQARNWIAQAKSNGYAVVATYHKSSVLGSDNTAELTAAADWWKANYGTLGGNFTINLMNEWGRKARAGPCWAGAGTATAAA